MLKYKSAYVLLSYNTFLDVNQHKAYLGDLFSRTLFDAWAAEEESSMKNPSFELMDLCSEIKIYERVLICLHPYARDKRAVQAHIVDADTTS